MKLYSEDLTISMVSFFSDEIIEKTLLEIPNEYKILVKQDNSIDYQFEIIYNMVVLLDPIIEHTLEFISDRIS